MSDTQFSLGLRRPPPVVKATLIALVALLLISEIGPRISPSIGALVSQLVFMTGDALERPWTLLSYALVQAPSKPWDFVFDCLAIYFFGPELEARWGKGTFLGFMAVSALGGSLFSLLLAVIGIGAGIAVGPTAICVAVVVAWGFLNRDRQANFFFVPMKGIHLVLITLAFEILGAVINGLMVTAPAFGGMLVGAAWTGFATGALREAYLKRKLKNLEAERDAVVAGARKKAASSGLRVISGGRSDEDDKRHLN
jgi:membrane associated rhomboid family serine protease